MTTSSFRQATIRSNLLLRAAILDAARHFFITHDYLEVDTPIRQPTQAPEEHIDAVASGKWYLQTSPELCMKRLLAAGYPRIFQICHCFRDRERGGRHLPEMTLLEWYTAGHDYRHMMTQTENLICHISRTLGTGSPLSCQGHAIDCHAPWPRMTVAEAFEAFGSISVDEALSTGRFDEIIALEIEPNLGIERPTFLIDYPAACGALARLSPDNPDIAERFELYIGGIELCNGFSELTDPAEQRKRFEQAMQARSTAGKSTWPMPEKFLDALKKMPPATGNALGLDRLVMIFADTNKIDDVVAFTPEEL
ncbi:MAG: EF-P lysine aminoacylase GenX [Deltaproteobacteria bacterium]|nr:MAG: EF-P lysine aminoacylase GenX [Deltaproteobacteria bacterium]